MGLEQWASQIDHGYIPTSYDRSVTDKDIRLPCASSRSQCQQLASVQPPIPHWPRPPFSYTAIQCFPHIIIAMVPTEDRATEWTRTSSQSTIISISPSTATTSANTIYKGLGSPSPSFQDRRRVSTVSTNLERSLEGRRVSTNSTNLERRRVSTSSGTRRLLANFTSNFSNNTSNSSRLSDFSLARSKRGSKRRKSYAGSKCMYEVNRFPFTSFNLTWIVFQLPPFGRHFDPLIHNEYTIR